MMTLRSWTAGSFLFPLAFVAISVRAPAAQEPDPSKSLAPFVPSPMEVVEKMLEMAQVTASDMVYDLGCGDGRIVVTAVKKYGCRGVGVDFDPKRVEESKERAAAEKVEDKVEIRLGDAMAVDLSPATVVTLYLLTDSNRRLKPILEKLRPGARVVSHNYEIPGWKHVRSEKVQDSRGWDHTVYLYRIEPRSDPTGSWSWSEDAPASPEPAKKGARQMKYAARLIQEAEKLSGTLRGPEGDKAIASGQIKGEELTFTVPQEKGGQVRKVVYRGKLEGDAIRGSVALEDDPQGSARPWTARRDPVQPEGTWRWSFPAAAGEVPMKLEVRRDGPKLAGTLDGRLAVENLSVRGARIEFDVEIAQGDVHGIRASRYSFSGIIFGDDIEGTFLLGTAGEKKPWRASREAAPKAPSEEKKAAPPRTDRPPEEKKAIPKAGKSSKEDKTAKPAAG